MMAITLRQPYAWASLNGMTTINLGVTAPVSYRGPLAIQAGRHLASQHDFEKVDDLLGPIGTPLAEGAVIGVVELHHAHLPVVEHGRPCCEPWGCRPHRANNRRQVHLSIRNPRPIAPPIPCFGKPELWTPDEDLTQQITSSIGVRR
ncbi:MAG: hypothetical protein JWO46_753 [Nocardioidaceae bacterium]|nr:hypothetical protein [Nocardioidaceae bacterium]